MLPSRLDGYIVLREAIFQTNGRGFFFFQNNGHGIVDSALGLQGVAHWLGNLYGVILNPIIQAII